MKAKLVSPLLKTLLFLIFTASIFSQSGNLDTSFNASGKQLIDFGAGDEEGYAVAIQSDGKIIVVGTHSAPTDDIYVCRLNTNGTLDATFGTAGKRIIDAGSKESALSVKLQSTGKIIIGFSIINTGKNDFALTRLNTDGSTDAIFGTAGVTEVNLAQNESVFDMVIGSSDEIFLAGEESNTNHPRFDFNVMKFTSGGNLNNTFDSDGRVEYVFNAAQDDRAYGIDLQSDGKIILFGLVDDGGSSDLGLVRLNTDGSVDASFGSSGQYIFNLATDITSDYGCMKVLSDDRIVCTGTTNTNVLTFMLDANGSLDNTFSTDGYDEYDIGSDDSGSSITEDQNGKILVAGSSNTNGTYEQYVMRYNLNGTLDTQFNTDGIAFADYGGTEAGKAVAINSVGDIFVIGNSDSGADKDFAVSKMLGNNAPTVTTAAAGSSRQVNQFSITGNITATGGVNSTNRGFVYDLASNPDPDITDFIVTSVGSFGVSSFGSNIASLSAETEYKVSAYATNLAGTSYGNVTNVWTLSTEPNNQSSTFTALATTLTEITLTFDAANIITNCDGYIILQRIDADPTGTPTDGSAYIVGNTIGDASVVEIIINGASTSTVITGLTTGTQYNYALIPFNYNGSDNETYNYLSGAADAIPTAFAAPGLATFSNFTIAVIDSVSAKGNYTVFLNGGATIIRSGIVFSSSAIPKVGNLANDTIIFAEGLGTFEDATFRGLSPGTKYFVRAYATNSWGTGYSSEDTIRTPDRDGISASVENSAPNGGDGNGDGILDSEQNNVASYYISSVDKYISIDASADCSLLIDVREHESDTNVDYLYPFGSMQFELPCDHARVKIYYHGSTDLSDYKYRKLRANNNWYNFPNVTWTVETVGGIVVAVATLDLYDGGTEDYDGVRNGYIVDPGGPVLPVSHLNVAVWDTPWAFLAMFVFLGIVYRFRKNLS